MSIFRGPGENQPVYHTNKLQIIYMASSYKTARDEAISTLIGHLDPQL